MRRAGFGGRPGLYWALIAGCLALAGWGSPAKAALLRIYGPELTTSVGPQGQARVGLRGRLVFKPGVQGLVRFALPALVRPLADAKLRVYVTAGSGQEVAVRRARGGWAKGGVRWWSRPRPVGPALGSSSAGTKGRWLEFDVTPAIHRSGGRHGFVLTTGSPGRLVLGGSRSAPAGLRPQLQLWLD